MRPDKMFPRKTCPYCSRERVKARLSSASAARFPSKLAELHLETVGEFRYKNNRQRVRVRCTICGHEQVSLTGNIFSGHGCASCGNQLETKQADFIARLKEKAPKWELVGEYKGATVATLFKHKECGKTFLRAPYSVTSHPDSCKRCSGSLVERNLGDMVCDLLPNDTTVLFNDRTVLNGRELDIYIPDRHLAIELDGLYYHCDEVLIKKGHSPNRYHLDKTRECFENGVRLVHVFEDEWLEHPDIVKDKIASILKVPTGKVYFARKLSIRKVDGPSEFLDANHIQGVGGSTVAYGLYNGNDLVAVQTFTKQRSGNGWELTRYATKLGTRVVGGFTKCLAHFEKEYRPDELISFADIRWSSMSSNVYEASGFELAGQTSPNYWYTRQRKRYHKFGFRKNRIAKKFPTIYSPEKTECQMMREAGYRRIYDCGLLKYIKKYEKGSSV